MGHQSETTQYSEAAVFRLKRWLCKMYEKGYPKFFEVFVDRLRVTEKTDDLTQFDECMKWIDSETQSIRFLIYNTAKSHRSQPFVFVTAQYGAERSKEEIISAQNEHILKLTNELQAAEQQLKELMDARPDAEKKGGFDLASILSAFQSVGSQNPVIADGLGKLNECLSIAPPGTNSNVAVKEQDALPLVPQTALSPEHAAKLQAIDEFLIRYPIYICEIHSLLLKEMEELGTTQNTNPK